MDYWGWGAVDPPRLDVDQLRDLISEFERSLAMRGYPDRYTCTEATWEKIQKATTRVHQQGIGRSALARVCGCPVEVFSTRQECEDYAAIQRFCKGLRVQLLR